MKFYYEDEYVQILHGDCREISLASFDLILTDPPYGINYNPMKPSGKKGIKYAGGDYTVKNRKIINDNIKFDPQFLNGLSKYMILWGANNYSSLLEDSGGWLVWDKNRGGKEVIGYKSSDCELAWTNLGKCVKIFSYFWHGFKRDGEIGEHYHPTQKPISLMKWCIELSPKNNNILDPFMGSGTTLRAAKDLGKKATGIEIDERYCEIAAKRMSQEVLDFN